MRLLQISCVSALALMVLASCSGGGDEPAVRKAYAEYEAALKSNDLERLKATVTRERAENMADPSAAQLLELIVGLRPDPVTMTEIKIEKATAEIKVKGSKAGQTITGTVELALEGGRWKVSKEAWTTLKLKSLGGSAPGELFSSVPNKVAAQLVEVADPDARKAGQAWIKLLASYTSAKSYLKDMGAALADPRPISFAIFEDSFTGKDGKTFRYFTTKFEPIDRSDNPLATTLGEALRLYLWQLEDVSNSGFTGTFHEWWQGYAARQGLPTGKPQ